MKGLDITKNKIAIIGFGISGKSIACYFLKHNIEVDVFEDKAQKDFDLASIESFTSQPGFAIYFSDMIQNKNMSEYDIVIASPGVPLTHTRVVEAKTFNIEVVTDISIFMRVCRALYPQSKIISVTGSNGKSTTVTLLYESLKAGGIDVYLGGNIGTSPLEFLDDIKTEAPMIVLETSSYQLEYVTSKDYFDVACILNLSDNHLNRYGGSKELYAKAKLGGIDFEKTAILINFDDAYTKKYIMPQLKSDAHILGIQFEHINSVDVITFENDTILYKNLDETKVYLTQVSKMNLLGIHNIYNAAFVCGIMHVLDIQTNSDVQTSIRNFGGLQHRVQFVDTISKITYINDSKSTSPDATIKALEAIGSTQKNVILISGGNDKDISYASMQEVWAVMVKGLVLLPGSANTKLKHVAGVSDVELIGEVLTMQEAVDVAKSHADEGDVVLLSPATDSHASFKSFEDRGNQFIECIQNLKK